MLTWTVTPDPEPLTVLWHLTVETVVHDVVVHAVGDSRTLAVTSTVPKFMPSSVIVVPSVSGALVGLSLVRTAAS